MSQETDSPVPPPPRLPTRELLLAQALEVCITAERRVPGSADLIIAHQPAWARTELRRLVTLAGSLDAVATNAVMSEDFRDDARARLMQRTGGDVATVDPAHSGSGGAWLSSLPSRNGHYVARRRRSRWLWRGAAGGLLAAVLGIAATLTASANALPGEPLYGIKQASEELGVRLAPDDQSRALALLRQADARLDETARLLQAGRTDQVAKTTQRFDEVIDRATTTFVVTIAESPTQDPTMANMETTLIQQQHQLQAMLSTAPEPARADLRQALVATERSRALVADPQAVQRAIGHIGGSKSTVAAPAPTVAAEDLATVVPLVQATPAPVALVSESHDSPPVRAHDTNQVQRDAVTAPPQSAVVGRGAHGGSPAPVAKPAVVQTNEDNDESAVADSLSGPTLTAHGGDVPTSHSDAGTRAPTHTVAVPAATDNRNVVAQTDDSEKHARAGDDVPQPAVVARPPAAKPALPPVVTQSERTSGDHGASDARPASPAAPPPAVTVKVQSTPAATSSNERRGGSGDSSPRAGGDASSKGDANSKGDASSKSDASSKGDASHGANTGGDHGSSDHGNGKDGH